MDEQNQDDIQLSKRERRHLKNERKRERKGTEQRKRQRQKIMKRLTWVLIGVGILVALVFAISNQKILPPASSQGHTEVSPQSHISAVPFSLNVQKHMLEHADGSGPPGIFINYNCEQFDCEPGLLDSLTNIAEAYPAHVYLAPYKNMSAKIVLTAEGRQETFDEFDEQRIRGFIGNRDLGDSLIDASADEISGLRVGDNVIYVADQKPGTELVASLVTLAENGYVVIHEEAAGEPGVIIGNTSLLDQGELSKVEVTLERASLEGETLIAMLHEDNGDGEFNPASDLPVKDGLGNIIFMVFQVSNSAAEPGAISL